MTAAAPNARDTFALDSVADVCAFIDDLPRDAAGELVLVGGASAEGAVFVDSGRVCWAAARGLSRRLGDLLAESATIDRLAMEEQYRFCKRERVPLGEHLVGTGIVSAAQMRAALLQHTSESLRALFESPRRAGWTARRPGAYSARFTFATPEVFARTGAVDDPALAERARDELGDTLSESDWGAAFVRSGSHAFAKPIVVVGACPDRVEPVMRLGRWACSVLDVISVLSAERGFVAALIDDEALVAWQRDGAVIAGRTSVYGPARLLNRRSRMRRKDENDGSV